MKKLLRIIRNTLLLLVGLLVVLWFLLQTPGFQNWLVQRATQQINKSLGIDVRIENARMVWLNKISLNGILLRDQQKDTLVHIGQLQVHTTDWLFFQDTVVLRYLALKDVKVKLQRSDTTWNYAFLEQALGGKKEKTSGASIGKKSGGLPMVLQLEIVDVEKLRFRQADKWKGKTLVLGLDRVSLKVNAFDLDQMIFDIDHIRLTKPEYREIRRNGLWSGADSIAYYRRVDSLDRLRQFPESWNPGGMKLLVRKLDLQDGVVEIFNRHGMKFKRGEFEEDDIIISPINGTFKNLQLLDDTLTSTVALTASERSGIHIRRLNTQLKLHPQMMEFDKLDLQLNESRLGPYFAMHYSAIDKMEYFVDSVRLDARLRNSQVSISDIAFFAPELKGIKQVATLSGQASGTVSNFTVNNIDLITGQSRLKGTYSMKGLTDIDNTIIQFNTPGSAISLADVAVWAPQLLQLKNTPVGKLGTLHYAGSFSGTAFDFVTNGLLKTDVGTTQALVSMRLSGPKQGFSARLTNTNIDAGKLLGVGDLGNVQLNGLVSSNGFAAKNPIKMEGDIQSLQYRNYQYRDLQLAAVFQNNALDASFSAADPNLNANINTVLNFNERRQRYNATGAVAYANLHALGFTKDSVTVSGLFDVDFRGKRIDDFIGYARMYDAEVYNGQQLLSVDSFYIGAQTHEDGTKELSLLTNEASVKVNGQFDLSDLGNGFQGVLHRYYPSIIPLPKRLPKNQAFAFEAATKNIEPFLPFVDPKLKGLNNSNISGSINTSSGELLVNIDAPFFEYGGVNFSNTQIKANGSVEALSLNGTIDNLRFNDSLGFPGVKLLVDTKSDTTQLRLTTYSDGPLGNAAINGFFYSKPDGFELSFDESSIIINNKKWTLNSNGSIALKNKYLVVNGVHFSNENQRIKLYTHPSDEGNWNDLFADVSEFNLGDVLPFFVTEPRMEGLISGKVLVEDPMGRPVVKTDLSTQSFYFNNDSVGRIVLKGDYHTASKKLDMLIDSRNPFYDFGGTLRLNLADSATNQIEATIDLRNERISVLKDYLTGILDNLDGFANGQLRIRGKLNSPQLLGDIKLSAGKLKVGYTQCTYEIDTATLRLGPNYINFGTITLRDSKNRKGTLDGIMYHKFFDSLSFNMRMRTDGMQVLNTTAKDNDLFFGDAVAKANFDLTGPLSNLRMRIIGITNDSSKIVISNKTGKESGEADFLRFKTYGVEMVQQLDTANTNIHITLDLTATPLCKIDVVMDELTGDMISASGNGNLKITAGTTDPTVMRGRFQIEKGSYNYSFQTLIKKPFELQGGEASYIEWTGDPYDATLNVKARYKATNVSMRDLMGSEQGRTILDQSAQNYKGDVYVNALVQGLLSSPRLTFDIEFPQGSPMLNNVSAQAMLRQIEADNSEMLRQVTYLIVFKQFAPYKEGVGTRNPGADLAVNTLSDLLSSQMGKMLTNLVQEITGDRSLSVDISTEVYNSTSLVGGNVNTTTTGYDRVNFNFMLNRSYFNNRVVVNLGSDFDLNVRNTTAAGFQFLPDVSIEFILTTNRRLRAILFKKDNLDFAGRRNRAGVSLSYRKEFDKLFSSDREEGLIFIRKDDKPDQ